MACRFPFKPSAVYSGIFLFLLLGCEIPRDNPLDPKNPDSYRARKIMVEAFVNTENNQQFNQYMLSALDALLDTYPDRLIVAEYHRNTEAYTDRYHSNDNELLYQHYLDGINSDLKGVPDVFINGIQYRIQGASSVESATFRLQEALSREIPGNCHYTLELAYEIQNDRLIPHITLARLGSQNTRDILIKAVLVSKFDNVYHQRVARGIVRSNTIPELKHGEFRTFVLPELPLDPSVENTLIAYVTDQSELTIYQSEILQIDR